jgi:hypothetical protein
MCIEAFFDRYALAPKYTEGLTYSLHIPHRLDFLGVVAFILSLTSG